MPERFFGEKHDSFEEAFPDIESLDIRVEETDLVETQRTYHYSDENPPSGGEIPCSNSRCSNGGFYLDLLVSEMVRKGETELDTREVCKGAEKIGNDSRTCVHGFNVEIEIEYVE